MAVRPDDSDTIKRINQAVRSWQIQAINLYRQMGVLHYPANYYANGLSRFRLFIGERPLANPAADPRERTGKDRSDLYKAAEEILLRLQGDQGGHPEILRTYGINRMMSGECWLAGQDRATETNWEILSLLELRPLIDGQFARFYDGGWIPSDTYKPSAVFRFWNADPFATQRADGPMEALAADCERLLILERSMTARMCSALAQAGYLYITTGMTMPGEAPTGDTQVVHDPFAVKLFAGMEKSILDGTGKFTPDVIRGPSGEKPEFITVDRVIDRVEMELRVEMRDNIAKGLDLPPEAQTGMGNSSHWQLWGIGDETLRAHMEPAVRDLCNGLNRVYLWPLLEDWNASSGSRYDLTDIRRLSVCGDGSDVASRPNNTEDARSTFDRTGTITRSVLRASTNFSDDDAPDETEYVQQIGVKINNPYLATYGMKVHDLIDWDKVAKVPAGEGAPGAGGTPPSRRPADPSKPDPEIPKPTPGTPKPVPNADQSSLVFAVAAEGHLLAARKQVGAQVRALAAKNKEVTSIIKSAPNEKVLATLDDWDAIGLDDVKVRTLYTEALEPLTQTLCDFDSGAVGLFVAAVSALATSRQHSPITTADLRTLAYSVLSRTDT